MSTPPASPMQWIAARQAPVIYLAHPVAAQPGEVLATCSECSASYTFAHGDAVDLRLVCPHDAPVRHTEDAAKILAFNLRRSMRWWRWLHLGYRDAVWLMPWYVGVTASDDSNPELRELGIRDCTATARRCDALMACGPRISSGMRREGAAAAEMGLELFQIAGTLREPPHHIAPELVSWQRWAA